MVFEDPQADAFAPGPFAEVVVEGLVLGLEDVLDELSASLPEHPSGLVVEVGCDGVAGFQEGVDGGNDGRGIDQRLVVPADGVAQNAGPSGEVVVESLGVGGVAEERRGCVEPAQQILRGPGGHPRGAGGQVATIQPAEQVAGQDRGEVGGGGSGEAAGDLPVEVGVGGAGGVPAETGLDEQVVHPPDRSGPAGAEVFGGRGEPAFGETATHPQRLADDPRLGVVVVFGEFLAKRAGEVAVLAVEVGEDGRAGQFESFGQGQFRRGRLVHEVPEEDHRQAGVVVVAVEGGVEGFRAVGGPLDGPLVVLVHVGLVGDPHPPL